MSKPALEDTFPDQEEIISKLTNLLSPNVNCLRSTTLNEKHEEANRNVYLSQNESLKNILKIIVEKDIRHVIDTTDENAQTHANFIRYILESGNLLTVTPEASLTEVYNTPPVTKDNLPIPPFFSEEVITNKDKGRITENLLSYLSTVKYAGRIKSDIILMADELITNVLFNAPLAEYETAINRKNPITLQQGNARLFCFAANAKIFIGSYDNFGNLNISALIKKLYNSYLKNISEGINMGEGGAGIGLRLLLDRSDTMGLFVSEKKSTTIVFSIPLDRKRCEELPKSIHLFKI
jgi:hypothetical protein